VIQRETVVDEPEARVGDEVTVASHRLRGAARHGTIRELLGTPAHRYYLVEWDDGRTTTFHPGPDAEIQPRGPRRRRRARPSRPAAPAAPPAPAPAAPPPAQAAKPTEAPRLELVAAPGDRLVIRGHHLGEPDRDAEVLETGDGGRPPFRVRWSDTGRVALLFPGSDAVVEHFPRRARRRG
jgi:hypothetical protein